MVTQGTTATPQVCWVAPTEYVMEHGLQNYTYFVQAIANGLYDLSKTAVNANKNVTDLVEQGMGRFGLQFGYINGNLAKVQFCNSYNMHVELSVTCRYKPEYVGFTVEGMVITEAPY
jgi:hypothetical protein